jgi:hypothetical protein
VSVDFEPVKLGPRRRRVDPVAVGALVVVIGVVAAFLKPWNAGPGAGTAPSDGAAAASGAALGAPSSAFDSLSGSRTTAVPVVPRTRPATTASLASWDDVRGAVRPHNAWGIRAIVAVQSSSLVPLRQQFAEVWDPLADDPRTIQTVDIEPHDQTVVAIGITFPATHTPLDARVWLVRPDRLEWVDTQPMGSDPSDGAFLYRLMKGGDSPENWEAGRYRIDVLVDGDVRRFGFTLPNRFQIVPTRGEPVAVPGLLIDPQGGALPDLPAGLFVTVAGVSIPLPEQDGPPLNETAEWLNVDPGTGRPPRSFVASVYLPATTGLGVILPPGSLVHLSGVRRLVPEPLATDPELVVAPGAAATPAASVLYRAPGGGAWAAGVYQLSVAWTDATGLHDRSWHIELRPGPDRDAPSLLAAVRGFARYAGSSGVVLGVSEPLAGGSPSEAIRLVQPGIGGPNGFPDRDRVPCGGVPIPGIASIAGVAYPVDAGPPRVTGRALFEYTMSEEQPMVTAGGIPGLMLVAPGGNGAATSDVYRARLSDDMRVIGATVCLSLTTGDAVAPGNAVAPGD